MKPKKKQKKLRITEKDFLLANRRAARMEEIEAHGRPVSFRKAIHKSKKVYDRKASSRRKTKDSWSFPPITFVSRPLTPPYVPFGIRRFLTLCAIERNSPLGKGSQHGEVYRSPQHGALCLPHWPNILCYCSHRFAPSMA